MKIEVLKSKQVPKINASVACFLGLLVLGEDIVHPTMEAMLGLLLHQYCSLVALSTRPFTFAR